jgi:hypothetical protein
MEKERREGIQCELGVRGRGSMFVHHSTSTTPNQSSPPLPSHSPSCLTHSVFPPHNPITGHATRNTPPAQNIAQTHDPRSTIDTNTHNPRPSPRNSYDFLPSAPTLEPMLG